MFGSSRLLDSISSFASKGGLGEAASWVVLRQDIYFSLTRSRPLYLQLENYRNSSSFDDPDAESIANRAVFLFAQILAYAFNSGPVLGIDSWNRLDEEVETWNRSKPWHATPLWVDLSRSTRGTAFPTVWLTRPAHVVSHQHYCLARIMLAIFNPHLPKPGFDTLRQRIEADASIYNNLRLVVELAISNSSIISACFHASHVLETCGAYLKDPAEQKEVVEFLYDFEHRTGWHTKRIIQQLEGQWRGAAYIGRLGSL